MPEDAFCEIDAALRRLILVRPLEAISKMKKFRAGVQVSRSAVTCVAAALAFPALALAAEGDAHPSFGPLLFALGSLVLVAKVAGLLAERWRQPSVLGELLAGIAVGNVLPYVLAADAGSLVHSDPVLLFLAEMGVLILLFDVGLEADLRALTSVGVSSLLVAVIGVGAPLPVDETLRGRPRARARRRRPGDLPCRWFGVGRTPCRLP